MKVVTNASILIGLGGIGRLDLLHERFPDGVLMPRAVVLLLDERDARRAAKRLGLRVLGTVGILIWARRVGKIANLREVLDALQSQGRFRISQTLYERALGAGAEQKK